MSQTLGVVLFCYPDAHAANTVLAVAILRCLASPPLTLSTLNTSNQAVMCCALILHVTDLCAYKLHRCCHTTDRLMT